MKSDRKLSVIKLPQPPASSPEAEQNVLGGLLLESDGWDKVKALIQSGDFFLGNHSIIFSAIHELATNGCSYDVITVGDILERKGELEKIGGYQYLAILARNTPSTANIHVYAAIVRRKALERRRIDAVANGRWEEVNALTDAITILEAGGQALMLPTIDEILSRDIDNNWLIQGWLEHHQTAVLFGESQSYKSLLAIDMACCIATGNPWRDNPVKQGGVLYIVGEGAGGGITRRFTAWQIANKIKLSGCPLFFVETPTTLPDDLSKLMVGVRETLREKEWTLNLIILDTLSKTMAGDERSSADFNAYQRTLDNLKQQFSCSCLIIHHTGHMNKTRERGVSEIACNTDVRLAMEIIGEKTRRLRAIKTKDAETPPEMIFTLATVELGGANHGTPVTSVVLRQLSQEDQPALDHVPAQAILALKVLYRLEETYRKNLDDAGFPNGIVRVSADDWKTAFFTELSAELGPTAKRVAWNRVKTVLLEKRKVMIESGFVSVISSSP
jgi:hypothetical protein